MPTPLRRRLRLARRGIGYVFAIVLVGMALVAGVVSQLLPLAERHPQRIEQWLSARVHRPVHFDHVTTEWTRLGPLLRLDGLRIGDGAEAIPIGAAEILVSQYAGLLPGRSFTELRLRGLELTLQRGDDGRWRVRGLPGVQPASGDPFAQLEGLGELQVIDGKLRIEAPAYDIQAMVPEIDLRLRVDGDRVRIGARARMRDGASPVEGRVDFNRSDGDGRGYLAARQADLAAWSPLLHVAGVVVDSGDGRIQAWARLQAHRISAVDIDANLQHLRLHGQPLAPSGNVPRADFSGIQARARWQAIDGGWRIDAPRLRIGADARQRNLDGLVVAGGQRYALLASRIDAGPLLRLAALSDRIEPGLRRWLQDSAPDAVLRDVEVAGRRGGSLVVHAGIEDLRFSAHGTAPGISGLSGVLDGDAQGLAFAFDPAATLRFDWRPGFGPPHDVHLAGRVAGWREGAGWRVETPALRVDGIGYGADVRGGLTFQGDGTRPVIDLAAKLDPAAVPVAKRFWVRHLMPEAALHWLDTALVGGRVLDGRAVVSGDLDDWPFRAEGGHAAKGLFQADARLDGAVVKFQPDWPPADHLDGEVSFVADGFTVKGSGQIAGVGLPSLDAGIAHFGESPLRVDAKAAADAGKLLALLKRSPLHKPYAETLDNLSASGPATASFALDLPLHKGGQPPKIAGRVRLDGAKLGERRWKLSFDQVRGDASYDREGFTADALRVLHDGQPGQLDLRAGAGHVRDRGNAFEAGLDATLDADALLDYAPDLAWLKPRVAGRSPWTVLVSIPKSAAAATADATPPARLRLSSNLIGTRLSLPVPLAKPAAASLATAVETSLPFGAGDITVAFGQRMALRARSGSGQTGVRVVLGGDRVGEAAPASGLVASGRTPELDAIEWMALTAGGGGNALPLRSLDITTDELRLLGGGFADVRLRAHPVAGATRIRADGPTLAGTLSVPRADGAAISGAFERVYWVGAPAAAGQVPASVPPPAAQAQDQDMDPAAIPPLRITVDDLRFGDVRFGKGVLHTRPVAAGLQIEQLQARTQGQQVDVGGTWLGRGAGARTHLKADVDSDDFGRLLSGFGFGGRLAGGHGEAHLDAAWPGSPAAFRLADLEGSLALVIKDGQLVEVEPGAGRVLGLLSVAQLPRRLMFDFRDLFAKGFAFNRIGGSVRFTAGQARSDDMNIDGPAAEIRIRGQADLRAQTFDQRIEVLPKSGNLLTVAGAIAGGPVGAAVGAVANAMLKKPLGEINARTYRVTGPWKDPQVEVVGHEAPPQPAATPAEAPQTAKQPETP